MWEQDGLVRKGTGTWVPPWGGWESPRAGPTTTVTGALYLRVGILVRPVPDENVSNIHFVLLGCEVQGCETALQREWKQRVQWRRCDRL